MSVDLVNVTWILIGFNIYFWLVGNAIHFFSGCTMLPKLGVGFLCSIALFQTFYGLTQLIPGFTMVYLWFFMGLIGIGCLVVYFWKFNKYRLLKSLIGLSIVVALPFFLHWILGIKAVELGTLTDSVNQVDYLLNHWINGTTIIQNPTIPWMTDWFNQYILWILNGLNHSNVNGFIEVLTYITALQFFLIIVDCGICFARCFTNPVRYLAIGLVGMTMLNYNLNHLYFSFMPNCWVGLIYGVMAIWLYQSIKEESKVSIYFLFFSLIALLSFQSESLCEFSFTLSLIIFIVSFVLFDYHKVSSYFFVFYQLLSLIGYFFLIDGLTINGLIILAMVIPSFIALVLTKWHHRYFDILWIVVFTSCWAIVLISYFVYGDTMGFIGVYPYDFYDNGLNFMKLTSWLNISFVIVLMIYGFFRGSTNSRYVAYIYSILLNPFFVSYIVSLNDSMSLIYPSLMLNIGIVYFVLDGCVSWSDHLSLTRRNAASIALAGFGLFFLTDAMQDTNKVYTPDDTLHFDYYGRASESIADMASYINSELRNHEFEEPFTVISQMEYTRALIPNVEQLYDYEMVYEQCQYCDVYELDLHEPDPLTNIFAVRQYSENQLYVEDPQYPYACNMFLESDFEYVIYDKNVSYNDGTAYFPATRILKDCSKLIYENDGYALYQKSELINSYEIDNTIQEEE